MKRKKLPKNTILTYTIILWLAIAFYLAITNWDSFTGMFGGFFIVIKPFVVGLVLAYLINPLMVFVENKFFSKLKHKRLLSILVSYLVALGVVIGLLYMILPRLFVSISELNDTLKNYIYIINGYIQKLADFLNLNADDTNNIMLSWDQLSKTLIDTLKNFTADLYTRIAGLIRMVFNFILGVIISIYLLSDKSNMIRGLKKSVIALFSDEKANKILDISSLANHIFSRFIVGKIIDSLIIGIICYIGMLLLGLSYPLLISVIVGCFNIIPFFGPILGAIPGLVILLVDPRQCLTFAAWILILQQFDGNILGPKILGDETGVGPIWIIVGTVVGGGLFGIVGMIIGVPTVALIHRVFDQFIEKKYEETINLQNMKIKQSLEVDEAQIKEG